MNPSWQAAAAFLLLFVTACAPTFPQITRNPSSPIRTVAVLPLVNNTNDVEAPAYVRDIFVAELGQFFYVIKPPSEVDQILKDQMGVTLGSQLDMVTAKQLGEVLGVDGVFYGSLDEFSEKITGVYNVKRVRLRSKLVNCKTGETVWKNGIGIKQGTRATGGSFTGNAPFLSQAIGVVGELSSLASSLSDKEDTALPKLFGEDVPAPWLELPEQAGSIEANIATGLGGKILEKAMNSPLKTETVVAVGVMLKGYYYPGGLKLVPYGTMLPTGSADSPAPIAK
jgi:hypothetical protein